MTLEQLDASLPNGFHDARFRTISIDFERRLVLVGCSLSVGHPDDAPKERDRIRDAVLTVQGVEFVEMEPPAAGCDYIPGRSLWVDFEAGASRPGVRAIPHDCFIGAFFVRDWNAFIRVAAREASIAWAEHEEV